MYRLPLFWSKRYSHVRWLMVLTCLYKENVKIKVKKEDKRNMKLILLGPPAAGKGTQAERIKERYSLAHISTGDMLRAEIAKKTALGLRAKALIDDGNLVPDDVVNEMVKVRIAQEDCKNGFLLDGYPRTIEQAKVLASLAEIDAVLDIDVDAEIIVDRVAARRVCPQCKHSQTVHSGEEEVCAKCGAQLIRRPDDTPESMRHRLEVYRERTYPLIEFYRDRNLLVRIDGSQTVPEVSKQIFDFIDSKIS